METPPQARGPRPPLGPPPSRTPTPLYTPRSMPVPAPKPRIGKLDPEGVPFVGGIPGRSTAEITPAEINRYRPRSFSNRRKTEKTCTEGRDVKFKGFEDDASSYTLMQFENYVMRHLEDTGMDSVFYHQTAADPTGDYYSIVTHHAH